MGNKELKEKRNRVIKGLEETYKKLVEFKIAKNTPLIVSKNGKVFELDPKKAPPTTIYR